MKAKLFNVMIGLLTLVALCLVSIPVLAGEHPWDSDAGRGGPTGTPGGPPFVPKDTLSATVIAMPGGGDMGVRGISSSWALSVAFKVTNWMVFQSPVKLGEMKTGRAFIRSSQRTTD